LFLKIQVFGIVLVANLGIWIQAPKDLELMGSLHGVQFLRDCGHKVLLELMGTFTISFLWGLRDFIILIPLMCNISSQGGYGSGLRIPTMFLL